MADSYNIHHIQNLTLRPSPSPSSSPSPIPYKGPLLTETMFNLDPSPTPYRNSNISTNIGMHRGSMFGEDVNLENVLTLNRADGDHLAAKDLMIVGHVRGRFGARMRGIAEVLITLKKSKGKDIVATTLTNTFGAYLFTVEPGTYDV
jgi:hypothetical protein